MPRKVIDTKTWTDGNGGKTVSRWYDDGATYKKQIDATGKTIYTSFQSGRGHRFSRGFGSEWYVNGGNTRIRDLRTGEVEYYVNGQLRYTIRRCGDAN